MQDFDEPDYIESNFVRDRNGERYYWLNEDEAIEKLVQWYEISDVDPEYRYHYNNGDNFLIR